METTDHPALMLRPCQCLDTACPTRQVCMGIGKFCTGGPSTGFRTGALDECKPLQGAAEPIGIPFREFQNPSQVSAAGRRGFDGGLVQTRHSAARVGPRRWVPDDRPVAPLGSPQVRVADGAPRRGARRAAPRTRCRPGVSVRSGTVRTPRSLSTRAGDFAARQYHGLCGEREACML
jgi:hypothetical protein